MRRDYIDCQPSGRDAEVIERAFGSDPLRLARVLFRVPI
jgi:hypothetical protein